MSLGDISVQGRHYLCRLSAGAALQSSIQPGWTLPRWASSCACPPLITSWNSLPWDLAVPWQICAIHTSSEPAHMVPKINPVCVQLGSNISGLTVLEEKAEENILEPLFVPHGGSHWMSWGRENQTKTKSTTNKTPTTNLKLCSDIHLIKVEVESILLSFKCLKVKCLF